MLRIGWFVVVYLTTADTTACLHCLKASTMLASQVAVRVPGVSLTGGTFHGGPFLPVPLKRPRVVKLGVSKGERYNIMKRVKNYRGTTLPPADVRRLIGFIGGKFVMNFV